MPKNECFWYIGESILPWEAAAAGALGRALIQGGATINAFAASGTDALDIPGILSWRSMTTLERVSAALFRGRLWHLWGIPPPWWPLVRFRARTVHTGFKPHTEWKGHPTMLSAAGSAGGETYIPPALEVKVNWSEEGLSQETGGDETLTCLFAGDGENMEKYAFPKGLDVGILHIGKDGREGMAALSAGRAVLLIEEPTPSLALLAANGALMGAPSASPPSSFMDEILGRDGYIRLDCAAGPEKIKEALSLLAGEAGRGASASARRIAAEQFTPERGAKKLENLYRSLAGRKR